MEWAQKLVAEFPYRRLSLRKFASVLIETGKIEEALETLKRLIALHPDDGTAYLVWASIKERDGDLDGTLDLCSKAVHADPKNDATWAMQGRILEKQGKMDRAIQAYFNGVLNVSAARNLFSDLDRLLQKEAGVARRIKVWKTVTQKYTDDGTAYFNLAVALEENGEMENAIEAYSKARGCNPQNDEYRNRMNAVEEKLKAKRRQQ